MTTSDTLKEAILQHAAEAYPNECCGVIVTPAGSDPFYLPCRNDAVSPENDFVLNPDDYAAAEDKGAITAIAHSHPDATTQPSDADRALCDLSGIPWHIVSWPEGDFRTVMPRGDLPLTGRQFVLGVYDCWGLVMSWFLQTHNIRLPDYRVDYPWWERGENLYMDNWHACGFREFTGAARPGDVALMQVAAPVVNHAGVLLGDNMLLHHLYGRLSQRTTYDDAWRRRTIMMVRHKSLF